MEAAWDLASGEFPRRTSESEKMIGAFFRIVTSGIYAQKIEH